MNKKWKNHLKSAAVLVLIIEIVLWIYLPYRYGVWGSIFYFVSTVFASPLQTFIMFDLIIAYLFISFWLYPQCRQRDQNALLWVFLLWTVGSPVLMYYLSAYLPETPA